MSQNVYMHLLLFLSLRISDAFVTRNQMHSSSIGRQVSSPLKLSSDELSVVVLDVDARSNAVIKVTYVGTDGIRRSWITSKSYDDFSLFNEQIPLFPRSLFNPSIIEEYTTHILDSASSRFPPTTTFDFFNVPNDLIDDTIAPTQYFDAEVVDPYSERARARSAEDKSEEQREKSLRNAGVAGAVLGALVGGPVGALAVGAGSVIAANREGTVGEVARTMGRAVEVASKKVKKIDREYHVVEKTAKVAGKASEKVRSVNRKYAITDKVKRVVNSGVKRVRGVLDSLDED
mmetsp:Transcript_32964/g.33573  ORF Transcript_32964/g.33573 Transcript_32964/m.33573 type:complete len:289 (+) Transcript_32964:183-1049(+)|eukprot:CAMPEP_0182428088 /NCGR_PEP_ID=MMETSP1167-20130531/21012_1 /TAXON_ID=2988 /ORGANISM="Mallomonas Sp, Strain CCMP3275" /LENGTH=288 /DNA_ID=CAMNT_0024610751 /DNA_START=161 /DNA_END=1027 /DNA_ORIENTATION=+